MLPELSGALFNAAKGQADISGFYGTAPLIPALIAALIFLRSPSGTQFTAQVI